MSATCTATAGVIVHRRRRRYPKIRKMIEFNAGPRRSACPAYPLLCVIPCCVFKKGIYFTYTIVAAEPKSRENRKHRTECAVDDSTPITAFRL